MAKYIIQLNRNFWPDERKQAKFYTGGGAHYRVPEDISHEDAEKALKQGSASRVEIGGKPVVEKMVAPETKDTSKKSGPTGEAKPSSSRPRGRPKGKKT